MKILIASTPATGHLNPLLTIGRILMSEGHEIVVLSGSAFRKRVETTGAKFRPFPSGADFDLSDLDTVAPELKTMPPGLDWIRVGMDRFFVDAITAQHKGMQEILQGLPSRRRHRRRHVFRCAADAARTEAKRPAVVLCGTSILHCRRPDKAPIFSRFAARGHPGAVQGLCGGRADLSRTGRSACEPAPEPGPAEPRCRNRCR